MSIFMLQELHCTIQRTAVQVSSPVELSISTAMDSPHHRNSDMTFWLTGECNHLQFEWPWIVKMLPHSYSMHLLNCSLYTWSINTLKYTWNTLFFFGQNLGSLVYVTQKRLENYLSPFGAWKPWYPAANLEPWNVQKFYGLNLHIFVERCC